jgi:uncharacterized damage-inducible protein DinB
MKQGLTISLTLMLLCGFSVYAQDKQDSAPAAQASGLRADVLNELAGVEKKLVGLAEAIPAEKYAWRPGQGVRSVSEVFMHVAGGNYNLPRALGTQPPAGVNPREFEKTITEKAKVIETLKQSFEHARQAVSKTSDADVDKAVKLFGRDSTYRGVFLAMVTHMHEHLGQMIAYTRMNGITPPWSAER